MNTNDNLMNNINTLWNMPAAELTGFGDGYCELIYRDQAVNEGGKAIYKSYQLSLDLNELFDVDEWFEPREIIIDFTAEDMEAYARTWKKQV